MQARLPVRMLFTGEERFSTKGNRVSMNVLSTLHSVSPDALDRMVEPRVDERPGPVVHPRLGWAEKLAEPSLDDQELTQRLSAVGELVGVRVLDPIVIGDGCDSSFLERGWIQP